VALLTWKSTTSVEEKRFCVLSTAVLCRKHSVASLGEKRFFSHHEASFLASGGDFSASWALFSLYFTIFVCPDYLLFESPFLHKNTKSGRKYFKLFFVMIQ
jgi:hypothetical protein